MERMEGEQAQELLAPAPLPNVGSAVTGEESNLGTLESQAAPALPTFEEIMEILDEEEKRMELELVLNEDLIPTEKKRGVCPIGEDKQFSKFLRTSKQSADGGTFIDFIRERRNEKCLDSIIGHCSQFVSYVKSKSSLYHDLNGIKIIEAVCSNQPVLFHDHWNCLLRGGALQPGTIQNRIDSLQYMIEWFRSNCNNDLYYKYNQIIERLKEERNRFNSINRKKAWGNTIDKLIIKRQWIEEGVPGLQQLMVDSWRHFDALVSLSCFLPLSRVRYSWALSYSLASLWCLSVNSRTKSIESLTMGGLENIKQQNFHLSTSFKTSSVYHYQVISSHVVGLNLTLLVLCRLCTQLISFGCTSNIFALKSSLRSTTVPRQKFFSTGVGNHSALET